MGRGQYESTAPTVYVWRDGTTERVVTIPTGTRSDLASTPRMIWNMIPPTGAYEDAAYVHDEGCQELRRAHAEGRPPAMSSRDVDRLFRDILCEADAHARQAGDPDARIPAWTRRLLWTGVRLGALANPARRAGWWRDAPAVAAIAAATGLVVAAAVWGLDRLVHLIF